MSKVLTTVTDYEEKFLELQTKVQADVLEYVKKAVDAVSPRIPEFDLPESSILDEIPSLSSLVDTQFAFRKKLLANREKFAKNLVKTVKPLTRDGLKPAKPAVKVA